MTITPTLDGDVLAVLARYNAVLVRPRAAKAWDELATTVTRWLGNDTRVLEFTEDEIATSGREEPVLDDVLQEGLTVAGERSWLVKQLCGGQG